MSLANLRQKLNRWNIRLIDGPNMSNLGRRDRRLYGDIASIDALHAQVTQVAEELGVSLETFVSNYEGKLLEYIHETAATTDAYLVNPGGLTTTSEGMRHALQETKKPVIEIHFYNLTANGQHSVFSPSVLGMSSGLRQYSYHAALIGLTMALDDDTFLGDGEGETVRKAGAPYAFTTSGKR
jgi:3-dehydroquinate dehydratase II